MNRPEYNETYRVTFTVEMQFAAINRADAIWFVECAKSALMSGTIEVTQFDRGCDLADVSEITKVGRITRVH